nr:unnamed protein product [Spirometra erinaceieuropaei]
MPNAVLRIISPPQALLCFLCLDDWRRRSSEALPVRISVNSGDIMAGEGGFDPCECIFNHESSMQRLLNMLRQSQAYCSDVSCTNDMNELRQGDAGGMSMVFGLLFAWILITFSMFVYRATQRGVGDANKPDRSHNPEPEPPALS